MALLLTAPLAAVHAQSMEEGGIFRPALDPDSGYRIEWRRGDYTQIACVNGRYYTIRYSPSLKRYFVEQLVNTEAREFDAAAKTACRF